MTLQRKRGGQLPEHGDVEEVNAFLCRRERRRLCGRGPAGSRSTDRAGPESPGEPDWQGLEGGRGRGEQQWGSQGERGGSEENELVKGIRCCGELKEGRVGFGAEVLARSKDTHFTLGGTAF